MKKRISLDRYNETLTLGVVSHGCGNTLAGTRPHRPLPLSLWGGPAENFLAEATQQPPLDSLVASANPQVRKAARYSDSLHPWPPRSSQNKRAKTKNGTTGTQTKSEQRRPATRCAHASTHFLLSRCRGDVVVAEKGRVAHLTPVRATATTTSQGSHARFDDDLTPSQAHLGKRQGRVMAGVSS